MGDTDPLLGDERVGYLPIIDRPQVQWPDGKRLAFWLAPNIEHYEYQPPRDPRRNPWPRTPHPDVQGYSHRDYGNRVGFWRMLEAIDNHQFRCTVSMNLAVFEHYPEVAEAMLSRLLAKTAGGVRPPAAAPPLNEPGAWDFFLSHGQAAAGDQVKMLCFLLRKRGKLVWYDNEMANRSTAAMEEGVKHSAHFLLFLSGDPELLAATPTPVAAATAGTAIADGNDASNVPTSLRRQLSRRQKMSRGCLVVGAVGWCASLL